MTDVRTLLTGIAFGESPRWHDGRLWFSDWGAQEMLAVDLDGNAEVIARVTVLPILLRLASRRADLWSSRLATGRW